MGNFASKMTRISLRPTNRGIIDFGELYYVEQTDLKEKKTTKKNSSNLRTIHTFAFLEFWRLLIG